MISHNEIERGMSGDSARTREMGNAAKKGFHHTNAVHSHCRVLRFLRRKLRPGGAAVGAGEPRETEGRPGWVQRS